MSLEPVDPAIINPGVRELVRRLREAGFDTTDSGDGETNGTIMGDECLPIPHVHMVVERESFMIAEADRLLVFLQEELDDEHPVLPAMIQATYDPQNRSAILSIYMVADYSLKIRAPLA